jgi:hypothetical protein
MTWQKDWQKQVLPLLEVAEFSFLDLCSQSFPVQADPPESDIDPPKVSFPLPADPIARKALLFDQAIWKRKIFNLGMS